MKKVFTILLGMILVISMVGCVCAADTTITQGDGPQSGDTLVSHTVAQGYSVTIPARIDIDSYGTISATITNIAPNHQLNIKITDGTYDSSSEVWKLTHTQYNDKTLDYYISDEASAPNDNKSPFKLGDTVLSILATDKDAKTLNIYCGLITTAGTSTYEGTYTDSLTFTVSIDPSTNEGSST